MLNFNVKSRAFLATFAGGACWPFVVDGIVLIALGSLWGVESLVYSSGEKARDVILIPRSTNLRSRVNIAPREQLVSVLADLDNVIIPSFRQS
jgi:hypothetical protein